MNDLLGLSIGTTNFVAVRAGRPPVLRRSLLTLLPHRRPELGVPTPHSSAGLLIAGFVEHVGDRQPLVAADGSTHVPELLLVDAIDSMVAACGPGSAGLCLSVPAYWPPPVWQGLRDALVADTDGVTSIAPPYLVPDVVATLTALDSEHGVASCGLVAVLDFGGGGTSITLVDAASGFRPITETVRYRQFAGNLIDQEIVAHVLGKAGRGDATVPGGTATVGDLAQLTDACRLAKEQLSTQNATEVPADLPGRRDQVALSRAELEQLIRDPLDGAVAALEHLLDHNRLNWRNLAAVAAVGGGAQIPLVGQRLAAGRRVPVLTAQRPVIAAAVGAALAAGRATGKVGQAPTAQTASAGSTAMASTASVSTASVSTSMAPMAPTSMAPAADTVDLPSRRGADAGPGAGELAWSQEEDHGDDVIPLIDSYDDDFGGPADLAGARPERIEEARPSPGPPRLPRMVLGLVGALVAAATVLAIFYALTNASHGRESQTTSTVTVPAAPPGSGPTSTAPPPPPSSAPEPSSAAPPPPPTTTAAPPPPATTQQTTTTTQSRTTTTTTTTTTTPPPTTTTPPPVTTTVPATTTVPMTTEYLNIPFVPVPIPIQVPE